MRLSILLLLFALAACSKKEDPELTTAERLAHDIAVIDRYLASNGITATEDASGLRYVIHTMGTGPVAQQTSIVRFRYVLRFLTSGGTLSGTEQPPKYSTVPANDTMEGLRIGLAAIPEGSTATLYIPSTLAFGSQPNGSVPANSILIFDLEFLDLVDSGPVTDADGNVYNLVLWGQSIWLAPNLHTTRYSNGESLDASGWSIYNDDPSFESEYGKLYSFAAATDVRNLCPTGYRIPTKEEWDKVTYSTNGPYYLKRGGFRDINGIYSSEFLEGLYWSSHVLPGNEAYAYTIYETGQLQITAVSQDTQASVVCIKEQ